MYTLYVAGINRLSNNQLFIVAYDRSMTGCKS